MANFESFTIYPMPRRRYAEVKAVLIERGYTLKSLEWRKLEDCVTTTIDGEFMTHQRDCFPSEQTYTVEAFLSKYGSLTKPLTIGEIHQLRELLKAHSPQPAPKPETYEGVFSFDRDGANCNYAKQRLYWFGEGERWFVVDSSKTEPHILVEAPHEVGQSYLLNIGNLKNDPTSYGLYDGSLFWHWTKTGCIISTATATNLKVVKA
jgi:hypothetical protein